MLRCDPLSHGFAFEVLVGRGVDSVLVNEVQIQRSAMIEWGVRFAMGKVLPSTLIQVKAEVSTDLCVIDCTWGLVSRP